MVRPSLLCELFDAQQRPIADAGSFARFGAAYRCDQNARRLAMRFLVPFRRYCDEFAVTIPLDDIGERDRRQGARLVQLLAVGLDGAIVGEIAKHALQLSAVGILQVEGARDFPRASLTCVVLDEGEQLLAGREGDCRCLVRAKMTC